MNQFCSNCGKEFEVDITHNRSYARKFCCDDCRYTFFNRCRKELNAALLTEKQCPACKEWFKPLSPRATKQKFCSPACREKFYQSVRNPDYKPRGELFCIVCGKKLSGRQTKYCSNKCEKVARNSNHAEKLYKCGICGVKFQPSHGGSHYTCPQCFAQANAQAKESLKPTKPDYLSGKDFDTLSRESAECGLSYGKYKAALKLGKTYEQLKAEFESRFSYD